MIDLQQPLQLSPKWASDDDFRQFQIDEKKGGELPLSLEWLGTGERGICLRRFVGTVWRRVVMV